MRFRLVYTHEIYGTKGDGTGHWCNAASEEEAASICGGGPLKYRPKDQWGWSKPDNTVILTQPGELPNA